MDNGPGGTELEQSCYIGCCNRSIEEHFLDKGDRCILQWKFMLDLKI